MNDIKETAKEIRAILKKEFPTTKFNVKIKRFSMGESVETSWTDGPTRPQVDALIGSYGDTRYRFINTSRKHSIEFADKVIKVWKEQNPEYAHLVVTSQGELNCYSLEVSDSEFDTNNNILQSCSDSVYKLLRNSTLETLSLATSLENTDKELVEIVGTPEPKLIKALAETTLQVQSSNQVSELEAELLKVQELLSSTRKLADTLETEVYRLTIQITVANFAQLANKAEITQITLTRDKGTIAESGTTVATDGWLKAERILKQWATTVSSPTRADKCQILFEFADGESFKLSSFELRRQHQLGVNLAAEMLTELQQLAGEAIPTHMTQEDYQNYCKFCKIDPAVYKRLLDRWAIPA